MSRKRRLLSSARRLAMRTAEEIHGATSRVWRACVPRGPGRNEPIPDAIRLDRIRRQADAALRDNVMPFWASNAWDDQHGGFVSHLDRTGRWSGPTDKYLVPQARLVWTFAAAHRHGLTGDGYLDLAGHGANFLIEHMWDGDAGGFVWAVARDGASFIPDKHTYGQAFAIYALSEYALAAGSPWARDWAVKTYDVLNERAGEGLLGFRERFDRTWVPEPGLAGRGKTVNTHLHLLEAFATLYEATADPRHAEDLRSVLDLVLQRGVHGKDFYSIDDLLENDWQWRPSWRRPIDISYGHAVELAWLAQHAIDALGDRPERIRASVLGLIDHALDFGFDHRRGGLALRGPPVGNTRFAWYLPATSRTKRWWEQAEMLVATLLGYQLTRESRYLVAFERQFDWVWTRQLDHACGDWFETVDWRDGRPLSTLKGHEWKEPYHGARALMEVSRRLSRVLASG